MTKAFNTQQNYSTFGTEYFTQLWPTKISCFLLSSLAGSLDKSQQAPRWPRRPRAAWAVPRTVWPAGPGQSHCTQPWWGCTSSSVFLPVPPLQGTHWGAEVCPGRAVEPWRVWSTSLIRRSWGNWGGSARRKRDTLLLSTAVWKEVVPRGRSSSSSRQQVKRWEEMALVPGKV